MRRILRNLLAFISLLLAISILLFAAFRFLPGDPARAMLGLSAEETKVQELRHELGLDKPLLEQYTQSILGIFRQDKPLLSLRFKEPVLDLIKARLPLSLSLALFAFVLILLIAIPLALLAAYYDGRTADWLSGILTRIMQAIPPFFMAMLLSLILATLFNYYRPSFYPQNAALSERLKALALPALAIALPRLSQAFQFLRDALVAEWSKDYVLTARSQGAGRARILLSQLLPNALIPFITASGLIFAEILSSSLIIEQVFKLPGIGQLLFAAVAQLDFPLAQSIILLLACLIISINRAVDFLNRSLDPRLTIKSRSSSPVTLKALGSNQGGYDD
ncbi:MAG: ABC transporter permease [Eubacteriales bacterium]|nr:ABC transporter permease [Eubacteriales bacterium]